MGSFRRVIPWVNNKEEEVAPGWIHKHCTITNLLKIDSSLPGSIQEITVNYTTTDDTYMELAIATVLIRYKGDGNHTTRRKNGRYRTSA
jgi:hypothetical protein